MANKKSMKFFIASCALLGVALFFSDKFIFADSQTLTAENLNSICSIYDDESIYCNYCNISAIDEHAFENYPNVRYLSLYGNQIEEIPDLSYLTNLQSLDISYNKIRNIDNISNLTSLTSISAYNNQIEELPDLSNLTNLQNLGLSYNKISDITTLSSLHNLLWINLNSNQIEEIPDLSYLTNLQSLDISYNKIRNIDNISNLTSLTSISAYNNQIEELPDLSNLTNLQNLEVSYNKLTDIGGISNLSNLYQLSAHGNEITTIPDLSNLSNISSLSLGSNKISDISTLIGLQSLSYLYLDSNEIEDLPDLSSLINLQNLYISNNKITDIAGINNMPNLAYVTAYNNRISDIPLLKDLPLLNSLDLSNNNISDISILNTDELSNLRTLNISNNQINEIPNLSNLSSLENLYLSHNNINDITPVDIPNLSNLRGLYLDRNQIESVSPFSNLNLETIDLSENCITTSQYKQVLDTLAQYEVRYEGQLLCYKGINYSEETDGNQIISKTATLDLVGDITLPESMYIHTFYKNGSHEFILPDMIFANKPGNKTVTVDGITDITKPICDIVYKTNENDEVVAELTGCNEDILVKNNNGSTEYTFQGAGTYEFQFEDEAGNGSTKQAIMYRDDIQCNNLRDNDYPIDDNFWELNPSIEEIVCALYGTTPSDTTAYTKTWGTNRYKSCNPKIMNAIQTDTLPSVLSKNTIYILNTDKIEIQDSISIPECSAIIGKDKVEIISKNKNLNTLIHRQGYSFQDIFDMVLKGFSEVTTEIDEGEFDDLDTRYSTYDEYYDFAMDYVNKYIKPVDNFIIIDNLEINGGYDMDELSDFVERFDDEEDIISTIQSGEIGLLLLGNYNSINNITLDSNIVGAGILLSSGNSISNITAKNNLGGLGIGIVNNSEIRNIFTYKNMVGFGFAVTRYSTIDNLESYNNYVFGVLSAANKNTVVNNVQIYNNMEGGMLSEMDIISLNNIQLYNNGVGLEVGNEDIFDTEIILNNVQVYNNEYGIDIGEDANITSNNLYIYNNDIGIYGRLDPEDEWKMNVYGKLDYVYNNTDDIYDNRYNDLDNYITRGFMIANSQPHSLFVPGIISVEDTMSGQCFTNPMDVNGKYLIDSEYIQDEQYKSIRYTNDEFNDEVISHFYSCIEQEQNTMEASDPISYEGDEIVIGPTNDNDTIGYLIPICQIKYIPRTYTSGNVVAYLANCDGKIITGGDSSFEFTENGSQKLEYKDLLGNPASVTANVFWIDRESPECIVQYTPDGETSGPVESKLICNEPIIGEYTYTFTKNGEHTFVVYDRAGNLGVFTGTVNNIKKNSNSYGGSSHHKVDKGEHNSADTFIPNTGLYDKNFSDEMNAAYQFAYKYGITTMSPIGNADMGGELSRIAMAKMLSQYAIKVLGMVPDTTRQNKFLDVSDQLDLQYDSGVTLAYQLGIMGINMPNNKFRPFDTVTRAEFATALSRLKYHTDDGEDVYYSTHIDLLHQLGIITNTNPMMKELRGYVMLMLMRSAEK